MPRSTLKNEVNSKETDIEKLINTQLGRKPVLPYNLDEELVRAEKLWANNKKY